MLHKRLELVSQRDSETVDRLYELIQQAKRGEIIGMAYIALRPGGDYSGDVVGVAKSSEVLTRGLVSILWDQIPRLTPRKRP